MNGYTWYVFSIMDEDGKFYAFAERIPNSNNLVGYAKQAHTMNRCSTKREAVETADEWNKAFIKNGTANKWLVA